MSKSESRKLTKTTTLRLSETEMVALREAAADRDIGPSALARVLVMRGIGRRDAKARARKSEVATLVASALGELGRIGSNINQIARVANATGDASALASAAAMQAELRGLAEAVMALRDPPA